jgi:hypothetical protein
LQWFFGCEEALIGFGDFLWGEQLGFGGWFGPGGGDDAIGLFPYGLTNLLFGAASVAFVCPYPFFFALEHG